MNWLQLCRKGPIAAVIWGLFVLPLQAEDETEPAWKAERAKLEQVIEERVEGELGKAVTKRDIVKGLRWRWPITAPKKTTEKIAEEVEKQIDAAAEKKYPTSRRDEFVKEAAEKYKLYKKGDEISFTIRGGMGTNTNVSGTLYDITPVRIRVGSRWIVRRDMGEETCANFYEDVSEKYQERYIRVENIRYDSKIKVYKADLSRERIPTAFASEGYVPKRRQYAKSMKPTDWISKYDVVDFLYNKQREKLRPTIVARITEEVFAANAYVLVEDTRNGTKEWMPKKEAETFKAKLKKFFEDKKAKEEEAKLMAADPWGEPAGGGAEQGQPAAEGMPMEQGMPMEGGMPGPQKQKQPGPQPNAEPNPFEENQ